MRAFSYDRKMLMTWNKDLLSRTKVIHFERKMTERSAIVTHEFLATKILLQDTNETWEIDSSIAFICIEIILLKYG